jgi:hypothetical protein
MAKFTEKHIGMRVIGNEKADSEYVITKTGYVGIIASLCGNNFWIQSTDDFNREWFVHEDYFDLIEPEIKEVKEDLSNAMQFLYNGETYYKDTHAGEGAELINRFALVTSYGIDKGRVGTIINFNKGDDYEYIIDGHSHKRDEFTVVTKIQSDVLEVSNGITICSGSFDSTYVDVDHESPTVGIDTLNEAYRRLLGSAFTNPMFYGLDYGEVDIIKSNKNYKDMNLIDKIRTNIKGKPLATLIKNDVLTLNETLTGAGQALFNDFLFTKFKDEFVKDIAPKLEELNDNE